MTTPDERSIDARISELQELARNCSERMMRASLYKNTSSQELPHGLRRGDDAFISETPAMALQRQLDALSAPPASVRATPARASHSRQNTYGAVPQPQVPDGDCPDFLWREGQGRYGVSDAGLPSYVYPENGLYSPDAAPLHKISMLRSSVIPNLSNIGRAAAVILLAGSFALFLATWLNSPVRAVVSTDDTTAAETVQGGRLAGNDIPARKVSVEKIVFSPSDNVLNLPDADQVVGRAGKPENAKADALQKKVKTITLAGLTPGQFVEKSWPVPGVDNTKPAQITQIKTEESGMLLAQVEATGAMNYLARGEMLLRTGDIATARLMFRKASEMGDARGAIGIASTYDPNVLRTLPVYGLQGNAQQARNWYEKAKELGASSEATARLEALSQL